LGKEKIMATIKFDDGREVVLSKETTERLRKELLSNMPKWIMVGQIFELDKSKYMVAAIGSKGCGLTCVGSCAGCYSSLLLNGVMEKGNLRKLLVKKNAKYLGKFNEVFEMKKGN
jgi:hypothetical protein